MSKKEERLLRVGILGCGPISQIAHFDACQKARNAELYAICDLADAERRGISNGVMFLAGSAINSIKDASGKPNPKLGAEGMEQAIEVHRSKALQGVSAEQHTRELAELAESKNLKALREAIRQRYPELA